LGKFDSTQPEFGAISAAFPAFQQQGKPPARTAVSESRLCSPETKNVTAHQHDFHRTWDAEREAKHNA
jgi:hypothetical protein